MKEATRKSYMQWSLPRLMEGLHARVEHELRIARNSMGHPATMGDASQNVWLRLLESYLPERYRAQAATVVDSEGSFSEQIDVVIYDRQYSPLLLNFEGQTVVPVEAVYAVFEAKQALRGEYLAYARKKIASVRRLHRTSVGVMTIEGPKPPKKLQPILGGFLALDSRSDSQGPQSYERILAKGLTEEENERLDLGCVAAVGTWGCGGEGPGGSRRDDKAATRFLLELMARLQGCGTVPAIDFRAYARWLEQAPPGETPIPSTKCGVS